MGKRKNVTIETAERPFPKITSAQKRQIARLYDKPATVSQIAQDVTLKENLNNDGQKGH